MRGAFEITVDRNGAERREHRRHNLEYQNVSVDRWDGMHRRGKNFGQVMDLSAGGIRIRTKQASVRCDNQIRVRLELPESCGISPFIDTSGSRLHPKREWIGWMTVNRVQRLEDGQMDVAGRLVDMEEIDRGMLGLYLSTMPLAA